MRRILRLTLMGLGNLPDYGPHPGTPVMVLLTLMAFVAGYGVGPWWRGLMCVAVLWCTLGVIFLAGAYQRADEYLRHRPTLSEESK